MNWSSESKKIISTSDEFLSIVTGKWQAESCKDAPMQSRESRIAFAHKSHAWTYYQGGECNVQSPVLVCTILGHRLVYSVSALDLCGIRQCSCNIFLRVSVSPSGNSVHWITWGMHLGLGTCLLPVLPIWITPCLSYLRGLSCFNAQKYMASVTQYSKNK